jgi:hypothetical protein
MKILHFLSIDYVRHRTWKTCDSVGRKWRFRFLIVRIVLKAQCPLSAPPKRAFVVRLALNSMVWTAKSRKCSSPVAEYASASRTFFINLPHNPLRPLNSSNDHCCAVARDCLSYRKRSLCCLQVTEQLRFPQQSP